MHTVKKWLRETIEYFLPTESLIESKQKWNSLANKNAPYFVMTDFGENITEIQFRESGMKDYTRLIEDDQLIQSRLKPFNSKTVLEIGCGIGRITEFLGKYFGSVSAIDISEKMIQEAKKRLVIIKNISLFATDGANFPFANSSFDFVFSFIVFQHMPDKKTIEKNLTEISRVLRSGGIAKIQLRGLPTSKKRWFYGPSFTILQVQNLIKDIPLKIIKSEGEGSRYFWVWFEKII